MRWQNYRLVDPVAHEQEWKTTVKPNIATLILDILILAAIGFFKPVLLLAAVPAFALFRLAEWKLAVWALKKKKAEAGEELPGEENAGLSVENEPSGLE